MALARIALEGAARAWHLLDPDVGATTRLLRCLNTELDALDEQEKAARREGNMELVREAGGEAKELLRIATNNGMTRSKDHKRRLDPYRRAADLIDEMLNLEHHSISHELSTVVHAQEDQGLRLTLGLIGGAENPHKDTTAAVYILPALGAADAVKRLGAYTGWDFSSLDEPTQRTVELWAHGAGLADDQYRAIAERQLNDDEE